MCDYCGCRLQPEIEELSQEHERLLDLGYRLRRLARDHSHAEVLDLVDGEFAHLLDHHTDKEERGLFAELRSNHEAAERIDALVDEHHDIATHLAEVRAGGDGWREALTRLVAELDRHIMDEEVDLFPYSLYELREAQWDRVAEVHAAVPVSIGTG